MDLNNVKVNGTEPDALTLTLHSLFDTNDNDENDNDEFSVLLTVVKPSLVNGQSVRVDGLSDSNELIVSGLNSEEERLSTPVKIRYENAKNVGRKDKDTKVSEERNKGNVSVRRSLRLSTPVTVPEPKPKRKKKKTSKVKRKSSVKVASEKKKSRLSSGSGSSVGRGNYEVSVSGEESRVIELEYRGEVKSSKKQKVERECCFVREAVCEAKPMEKWAWRRDKEEIWTTVFPLYPTMPESCRSLCRMASDVKLANCSIVYYVVVFMD
ncbi:hypothetical protein Tco_0790156 [Tanacetum coccineum]